ncbi:MAG: malto-oligosyltrehalose trehalohydrolase [Acidobacteria bacterium]|nr:malto-oligosyltrehalose trehalohydrolase [Acidobacteriota bacterium]
MRIGAYYLGAGKCRFIVWSPNCKEVTLRIVSPTERSIVMTGDEWGYFRVEVENIFPGTQYFYRPGPDLEHPDPASQYQPLGVHGPSEVVDHQSFQWEDDDWKGINLSNLITYELHIGTFTREGTFDAVIDRLDDLLELGINAIEIMPIAQFPGERNWGYDGVYPFAAQHSYGGPQGLKRLVNACHQRGLALLLDVVYNHLGPEGNYLARFAPYFNDKYRTPWGSAINFDDLSSDGVRNYFIENALYWLREYHIDGLRLDAIETIGDRSAQPFLQELADRVRQFARHSGRQVHLIAESDLNDPRVISRKQQGGFGLSAQWNDDFHHALHTLLSGERQGYYADFGKIEHLVKAYREGFVYSGEYSVYRRRRHGATSAKNKSQKFIVFAQNHDQIGNRAQGERLSNLITFESLKLAAGAVMLAANLPMLFMGEEYGEDSPFLYFVSHGDPALVEAVREGRHAEFAEFHQRGETPDPQSPETFLRSKLKWEVRRQGHHGVLLEFYRSLINLRRSLPALSSLDSHSKSLPNILQEENRWRPRIY